VALILPSGARFTIHGQWTNQRPILTTWHAIVNSTGSRPQALEEVAGMIGGAWASHALPLLANNYTFQVISFLDLDSLTGVSGQFSLASVQQGSQIGTNVSPYNGVVATKNILTAGRGRKNGRVFLPGVQASNIDEEGKLSDTLRNGVSTALDNFLAAVNNYTSTVVADVFLVVAHTPFVSETRSITRSVPAKNGQMTASAIQTFAANPVVSGLRARVQV
jgi:hypothetical protein